MTQGETVNGVLLNLVDVRAYPARVKWIGEPGTHPTIFDENEMMFLGVGATGAVFYTVKCTTIIVPTAV